MRGERRVGAGTRARWIALVFAVALVALTAHNVWRLIRNQQRLACNVVLCREPRDIEKLSAVNAHPSVHGRLAIIYFLGQRIPGARSGPRSRSRRARGRHRSTRRT